MTLRPIPRCALTSEMKVRIPSDSGGFKEPVSVSHVRYMDVRALDIGSYEIDDDSNGIVYMDAVNSEGSFDIPVGSLVSIDGSEERSVVKITREIGFGKVHHWKLEVR